MNPNHSPQRSHQGAHAAAEQGRDFTSALTIRF
jgi:hypothetical protein